MATLTVLAADLTRGDLIRVDHSNGILVGEAVAEGKQIVVYPFTGYGAEIAVVSYRRYVATASVRLHRRGLVDGPQPGDRVTVTNGRPTVHRPVHLARTDRYGDIIMHGPYCGWCGPHGTNVPWPCHRAATVTP